MGAEKESGEVEDKQVSLVSYKTESFRRTRQDCCRRGRPGERVPLSRRRHHDGSMGVFAINGFLSEEVCVASPPLCPVALETHVHVVIVLL